MLSIDDGWALGILILNFRHLSFKSAKKEKNVDNNVFNVNAEVPQFNIINLIILEDFLLANEKYYQFRIKINEIIVSFFAWGDGQQLLNQS